MQALSVEQVTAAYPVESLRELATFGALPDSAIESLLQEGRLLALDAEETLFETGSKPETFYVILQGEVAIFRDYHGQRLRTRSHRQGEQIGFAALIALHDRSGNAIAMEPSWVLEISLDQFRRLQRDDGESFGVLMMNLARGMARTINSMGSDIAALRAGELP
jgi:CRP-like cAMP-binding protein